MSVTINEWPVMGERTPNNRLEFESGLESVITFSQTVKLKEERVGVNVNPHRYCESGQSLFIPPPTQSPF